jgi:hypothetical protein
LEYYAENTWFSSGSQGLTAGILADGRVNKKFSSFE